LIRIVRLPEGRWREYRKLRLEALKTEPSAFGSSLEEESRFTEDIWRKRIKGVLFALADGRPVGLLSYIFEDRVKTRHVARIYGVYVTPMYRGRGIGERMLKRALAEIGENRDAVKAQLSVNPLLRPAIALYKKAGFEVAGRARKELKIGSTYYDMLLMEKEIRNASG
jgi:ribosomal protein S18 acetylase RimI-like enzyme